jgi:deoxyribonuclease (pyrimidine dimer)
MTRINAGISPSLLANDHLIAEIKEILQLAGQFKTSLISVLKKNKDISPLMNSIPTTFRLNTGHVKYFYNKPDFLKIRFLKLKEEAINRGFAINAVFLDTWAEYEHLGIKKYCINWIPNSKDNDIIIERITSKVRRKVQVRYKKEILNPEDYIKVLTGTR